MSVLIKPVVTEKTTSESELRNRYTFLVDPKANKVEIKKAVEATYGVTVDKVPVSYTHLTLPTTSRV